MLSEKEKMFKGEKYLPFSQQLVEERENCKAALWRFNHSMDPGRGVTREERTRLFKAILQPSWIPRRTNQSSPNPHPIGSLGSDVCVEAPFYCEYGYNINIGPDVVIGPNCTILDPCIIIISARCIIGPNVNIYGNSVDLHPARRQGSKGPAQGKRIVIEEDCFIGGNVTICPGVTIGKGSTVAAGSVVINDIPRYVLAAGNPTRVVRGMYGVGQG
ncbi:putative nodulation protein L [Patellaria atrata CBS 101060]|uniref:Nodulation protein L n=1 Tax=Patellaria atrata CBS 101060 TaxID=1346257 RepID=A0A9P4SDA0_9PEZI|nr:putative nodulation protein L [Patellaria atrata CBS 101060]